MKIDYIHFHDKLASYRYRCLIPLSYLKSQGVGRGKDILIASKHGWDWDEVTKGYKKVVMDVCDDHFGTELNGHYYEACKKADLVVCNSKAMKDRLYFLTGREAVVIEDPYEDIEMPPSFGETVCWFGHKSNLQDLGVVYNSIRDYKLEVVSNADFPGVIPWTPESQHEAILRSGVVIIPTGKSMAKSANRLIKSIRYGKFVVAGNLPSHSEIPGPYIGDIREGLAWAFSNQDDAIERTRIAQEWISDRYSPETIGEKWLKALSSI